MWTLHREMARFASGCNQCSHSVLVSTFAQGKKILLMAVGYEIFFLRLTIEGIRRFDVPSLRTFCVFEFVQFRYP